MADSDVVFDRLEDQLDWYDRRSTSNQKMFKRISICEIVAAASIPLAACLATPVITGVLGVLVVVLQGLQQLNQFQHNWITYRSTCEELKHEKYLSLAKAGPYAGATDPRALLAERVESLVSREHSKWISVREQHPKTSAAGRGQGAEPR